MQNSRHYIFIIFTFLPLLACSGPKTYSERNKSSTNVEELSESQNLEEASEESIVEQAYEAAAPVIESTTQEPFVGDIKDNNEMMEEASPIENEENPAEIVNPSEPMEIGLSCDGVVDVIVCDDFESGKIDTSKWQVTTHNGRDTGVKPKGEVDSTQAKGGEYALHITLPKDNSLEYFLHPKNMFPVEGNRFFGRGYIRIGPTAPQIHHYALAALSYKNGQIVGRHRLDSGNKGKFRSNFASPETNKSGMHGGISIPDRVDQRWTYPINEWICLEWEFDGPTNSQRFWFNGELAKPLEVVEGNGNDLWKTGEFTDFHLGWHVFQPSDVQHIYWDSIVIAKQRIGCGE